VETGFASGRAAETRLVRTPTWSVGSTGAILPHSGRRRWIRLEPQNETNDHGRERRCDLAPRGEIEITGLGSMPTWYLLECKGNSRPEQTRW